MHTRNVLIVAATGASDRAACFAIRQAVFVVEQGVASDIERDLQDDAAVHLLATVEGVPVGTARAVPSADMKVARIGRVAVLKSARGAGVGAALMRTALQEPSLQRVCRFELHAQIHAVAFYERLGYAVHGEPFEEAGIAHVAMVLDRH